MNKDDNYNYDTDPDFNDNFYKNIEKVLSDVGADQMLAAGYRDEEPKEEPAGKAEDEIPGEELAGEAEDEIPEEEPAGEAEDETQEEEPAGESGDEIPGEELTEEAGAASETAYTTAAEEELSDNVDDALLDINASLAKQICEELGQMDTKAPAKDKMSKGRKILSVALIVLACLVAMGSFLGFTKPGNKLLMRMGINIVGKIWATSTKTFEKNPVALEDTDHLDPEDLDSDAEEADPNTIKWPEHPGIGRQEKGVYNILLLGEEAIGSGSSRGRTDLIIIATMNTNTKELKLTSLMRDSLVRIPGYLDNKLNTAYEKGGLDLLYETISMNYDIRLDGCIMVNFDDFEKIIDRLGGIEITLTASEAKYLNNTNYISKPQYRNVYEGKQLMNGNQVLGYTRIRRRATISGVNNDYGRTERHRIVLDAIFEKYKTKGKIELSSMMLSLLPMITTDINSENFELLLNSFIKMGTTKIDQLRLPADGTFTDNVEVRGMDVLILDWDENVTLLHEFIFGNANKSAN